MEQRFRNANMELIHRTNRTFPEHQFWILSGLIADNFHQVIIDAERSIVDDNNNNAEYHMLIYDLGLNAHNLTADTFITFINFAFQAYRFLN